MCKSFGSNLLPNGGPEVGVSTVLKKRQGDATLSLQFNDATLRDPKSAKGVVLTAEKPLGGGWVHGWVGAGEVRAAGRKCRQRKQAQEGARGGPTPDKPDDVCNLPAIHSASQTADALPRRPFLT